MKIKITKEQLLAVGARTNCHLFQRFLDEFDQAVTIEWTLEKQIEFIKSDWKKSFGWLIYKNLLPLWSMRGANLSGADLSGADLSGANLHEADLRWANLHGASLNRADLRGVDLRGANLSQANLREADLYGVNLNCANLSEANLNCANLSEAKWNDDTLWPAGYILEKNLSDTIIEEW